MLNKLKRSRTVKPVAKPLPKVSLDQVAGILVPRLGEQDVTFDGFTIQCQNASFHGGNYLVKRCDFS